MKGRTPFGMPIEISEPDKEGFDMDAFLQKLNEANEIGSKLVALGTPKTCTGCEYFDGGGQRAVQRAIESDTPIHGDCLNRQSPRFQTWSNETCPAWSESST
jgi:hypothetical protein